MMQLIPKNKFIESSSGNKPIQFPLEIPTVVRNWCIIGSIFNFLLLIFGFLIVFFGRQNSLFNLEDPLILFIFIAPTTLALTWRLTASKLNTGKAIFSKYPYRMDVEWVAVITIGFLMALSAATAFEILS